MSDDENDLGEIKLSDKVLNADYEVSDLSEDSDLEEYEDFSKDRTRLRSIDENTETNAEILNELLTEIATAEAVSRNLIRIELYNKKKKFLKKNEDVEFDSNEFGYPFVPAECEEYLLPFLQKMKDRRDELKGTKIETNIKNVTFKF